MMEMLLMRMDSAPEQAVFMEAQHERTRRSRGLDVVYLESKQWQQIFLPVFNVREGLELNLIYIVFTNFLET